MGAARDNGLDPSAAADLYRVGRKDRAHDVAQECLAERPRIRNSDDSVLHQPGRERTAAASPPGTRTSQADPSAPPRREAASPRFTMSGPRRLPADAASAVAVLDLRIGQSFVEHGEIELPQSCR